MNNENKHPVMKIPPLAHALHHWDMEKGVLTYEYNGINIIEVEVPSGTDLGFRHGSDGSMQSVRYIQQVYLSTPNPCRAKITFRLNKDFLNLRPNRAINSQAILGTQYNILNFGVNGLYDTTWDLFIEWYGREWGWISEQAEEEEGGYYTVSLETELSMSALYINILPWYYSNHLGYKYYEPWNRKPNQSPVSGWCSWEAFRRDICIEKVKDMASFLRINVEPYGLEYLQVDDGYQEMPLPAEGTMTMAEGWMTCDKKKFPLGHQSIVDTITESGLKPAIWFNANITNSEFSKHNSDSIILHNGVPLKGEWIDYLYNCNESCLSKHVEPILQALTEKGYKYVKIDAIRHLLFDGLHECVRLGIITNEEASQRFRKFMEATSRGKGEDVYYLASWGEMHEVIGLVDACRISMDANPTWAGVRMQLFESARWYHTHRILFTNDPDHVCARTNLEWARSVLSLVSLSGQVYMLSDSREQYTEEKLNVIRKTLPPLTTKAGETGDIQLQYSAYTWTKLHGFAVQSNEAPVSMQQVTETEAENISGWYPDKANKHPFSTLWSFAMNHHGQRWRVLFRVATNILEASVINLDEIALDPNKVYIGFDFWKQKYLGEIQEQLYVSKLPLGNCEVIGLYEKPNVPTIFASDRHVSMDAISIDKAVYKEGTLNISLSGVKGEKVKYYIYIPEEYANPKIDDTDIKIINFADRVLCISVDFQNAKKELTILMERILR